VLHERQEKVRLFDLIGRAALVAALRIATVEDQFGDPFRMSRGVVHGNGCALRDAKYGKLLCLGRFDNGFKIARKPSKENSATSLSDKPVPRVS
jgi:hypothetical protein